MSELEDESESESELGSSVELGIRVELSLELEDGELGNGMLCGFTTQLNVESDG